MVAEDVDTTKEIWLAGHAALVVSADPCRGSSGTRWSPTPAQGRACWTLQTNRRPGRAQDRSASSTDFSLHLPHADSVAMVHGDLLPTSCNILRPL